MQAPLAVLGFVLGIVAWRLTGSVFFLIGGAMLLANLAMNHFRRHADQQDFDGDRPGGCEFTNPGFDCEVESSSFCPDIPWVPRDPGLSDRAVTTPVPRHFEFASDGD